MDENTTLDQALRRLIHAGQQQQWYRSRADNLPEDTPNYNRTKDDLGKQADKWGDEESEWYIFILNNFERPRVIEPRSDGRGGIW